MDKPLDRIDHPQPPIEMHSIAIDEHGNLRSREPDFPLKFRFRWRDSAFEGEVGQNDSGLYLELRTELGALPYTAENDAGRANFVTVTSSDQDYGTLRIVQNQTIVFEKEVELPRSGGLTATTLVTHIAILVLSAAPYLDLLAELGLKNTAPQS